MALSPNRHLVIWQEKQSTLFKEEIESLLAPLSDTPILSKMVSESLDQYVDELAIESENTRPWPLLPLVVCEGISTQYEHVVPVAVALQFLRAAADIFDDIEDADSPKALSSKYGSAESINVATTLIMLAEKAITRLKKLQVENDIIILVMDKINSYHTIACVGQHMDLTLTLEMAISEEEYLKIASMKSAFQVECACHIAALLATPQKKLIDSLTKFGHNLGMAVQLTNDIQGITQGRDILKKRITLPIIYALAHSDSTVGNQIRYEFSHPSKSASDFTLVKDLLFRCGAIHYASVKLELYKQQALDILSDTEKEGVNVERLKLFVT